MNAQFNELVSRLSGALGGNLVSVIAYGSAIAAPGNPKKADYQVLAIARRLSGNDLRLARPALQWWTGEGYAIPTLFTETEFAHSLDVFPIEFRHMRTAYEVIHGRDPLAGASVSDAHLRWQTEHELRGKLLRLRSLHASASATAAGLTRLMTESVVSFIRLMRPILELHGETPPLGRLATARMTGERLGIDAGALVRLLQLREEPRELMEAEAQDLFSAYLDCLSRIIDAVDRI
ncbi:MAG: hypothetical protein ACKVX9_18485 [Blastocatellia bacterium]